jgi:hypothetical protein
MDGLDVESQLEAAGAGDGGASALDVLSMGQALYEILSGQVAAPQPVVPVLQMVSQPTKTATEPPLITLPPSANSPIVPPDGDGPQQLTLFDPSAGRAAPRSQTIPAATERPQQLSLFDLVPAA